jgi:hypothetical protein
MLDKAQIIKDRKSGMRKNTENGLKMLRNGRAERRVIVR